ncbi:MAG: hypothetical protein SNF68_05595 [Rikenellaceae bacterium]
MDNFSIDSIGRDMPYKLPREDFFETFPERLFAKIEFEQITPIPPMSWWERYIRDSRVYAISGVAAAVAVVLITLLNVLHSEGGVKEDMFAIEDSVIESMDAYLSNLSDSEFEKLFSESFNQRDFYLNLPNL